MALFFAAYRLCRRVSNLGSSRVTPFGREHLLVGMVREVSLDDLPLPTRYWFQPPE